MSKKRKEAGGGRRGKARDIKVTGHEKKPSTIVSRGFHFSFHGISHPCKNNPCRVSVGEQETSFKESQELHSW